MSQAANEDEQEEQTHPEELLTHLSQVLIHLNLPCSTSNILKKVSSTREGTFSGLFSIILYHLDHDLASRRYSINIYEVNEPEA